MDEPDARVDTNEPVLLRWLSMGGCGLLLVACQVVTAWGQAESTPFVFDIPAILTRRAALRPAIANAIRQQDYPQAERLAKQAVELVPFDQQSYLSLAQVQAATSQFDAALESLARVIELGPASRDRLSSDPLLAELQGESRFAELLQRADATRKPKSPWHWSITPSRVTEGKALVGASNTAWAGQIGAFVASFQLRSDSAAKITTESGFVGERLRGWYAEGTAAGNHGDFYDNFDRGHSQLDLQKFPQLTAIVYGDAVGERQLDTGLQNRFLFGGAAVIGNSSTAITDDVLWRSQPRLAYVSLNSMRFLYTQYTNNHLYVYPEHRDHDPGHNGTGAGSGHGDVFVANTPYVVVSQGSSYSDKPFLEAFAATLAAFRPDVKKFLIRNRILAPTLQMTLRRTYGPFQREADYLSGRCHPSVFDGARINLTSMVALAHDIERGSEPPLVQLHVVEEDQALVGRDYFHPAPAERLFDTPGAIARVYRTVKHERRMVVSAERSRDFNGRPLTFHWSVLRGDPAKTHITPLNESGSVVEIRVAWQPRRRISQGSQIESNRVDIGAFVKNGAHISAPGFVTHFFLDNERRQYNDAGSVVSIEYGDENYVDPAIDIPKQWRDEYHHDETGRVTGWTRHRKGQDPDSFTAEGFLVIERDGLGRPNRASKVRYVSQVSPKSSKRHLLRYVGDGAEISFRYESDTDRRGSPVVTVHGQTP